MVKKIDQERKQRILIVCQHFWPESFRINDIADYLVNDKGVEVDVLCGIPNYPSGRFTDGYSYTKNRRQTHNKVNIRRVFEIPRGNNSNLRIFLNYISFPIASLFHIPYLLTKKYDNILIYQLSPVMMSLAGLIVGKIKRIETTMYVLDLWPENLYSVLAIKNSVFRKIAEKVSHWHYRKADKLILLSETMKNKLEKVTTKNPNQFIVLPQACEKIYETHIEDSVLDQRFKKSFNVLYTGNISPAQSFPTMVEAALILKEEGFNDIHWVIVGDGMSKQEAEKLVNSKGLSSIFSFEGQRPVEDIPRYTNIADVLVGCLVKSNLLEATIPAKVMSYIASSRPVVLAMDGEVKDLIENKAKCGYVGETEDARQLANNIKKVYVLSLKDRKQLGESARKFHFKHLERNIILGKMYEFMNRSHADTL